MCNNNPHQTSDNSSNSQGEFWQRIDPDIREFLQNGNTPHTQNDNTPQNDNRPQENTSRMSEAEVREGARFLMRLFGVDPQVQEDIIPDQTQTRQTQEEISPSAPPQETNNGDNSTASSGQQQQSNSNGPQQFNNNGNRHQQQQKYQQIPEEIVQLLINKFEHFTSVFSRTLSTVMIISAIVLFISILPSCLISNLVFMVIAAGLGLHIPSVIFGNIILTILGNVNPIVLILMLGFWAYRRTVIHRQPLFRAGWFRNIIRHCQPTRQHQE